MRLSTVEDTRAAGAALAAHLKAGDLVLLTGPLGAGKTAFAQGVGRGLGVLGSVCSPTFVIARVHRPDPARRASLPMVHVDAYRLDGRLELDDLDLDTGVEESVTVVEWGHGVAEQLADGFLEVRLTRHDDDSRTVTYVPVGEQWSRRLELLWQPGGDHVPTVR